MLSCMKWVTVSVTGSHPNRQLPMSSIARLTLSQGLNWQSIEYGPHVTLWLIPAGYECSDRHFRRHSRLMKHCRTLELPAFLRTTRQPFRSSFPHISSAHSHLLLEYPSPHRDLREDRNHAADAQCTC